MNTVKTNNTTVNNTTMERTMMTKMTTNEAIKALKDFLFTRNIVTASGDISADNNAPEIITLLKRQLGIIIADDIYEASLGFCLEDLHYIQDKIGVNVPEAFYRGFPESVRKLSDLEVLVDRLIAYHETYGINNFDGPAYHSILEDITDQVKTVDEHIEEKKVKVISETNIPGVVHNILFDALKGSRPLDNTTYDALLVYAFRSNLGDFTEFTEVNSRQTLVQLYLDTKSSDVAERLRVSDVYKIVKTIADENGQKMNSLNLKNQQRNQIAIALHQALASCNNIDATIEDAYEHRKAWNGVLHHIHFKTTTPKEKQFVDAMRSGDNNSVRSQVEKLIQSGDTVSAAKLMRTKKGGASVIRMLDYLISRSEDSDIDDILDQIETDNATVLYQQYEHYCAPETKGPRTFVYHANNRVVQYKETADEANSRQTRLDKIRRTRISNRIRNMFCDTVKGRLSGTVFVADDMNGIAIEPNASASNKGIGTLPAGSRIKLDLSENKVIRAFTYWEKVNDIDISAIAVDDNFKRIHEYSWRSYHKDNNVLHSGDQTEGYYGGTEYIDINVEEYKKHNPDVRYLILCNNVYLIGTFKDCICRAGYMIRSNMGTEGLKWSAKTVATAFDITADSTYAVLFMVDLKTNELIWVNRNMASGARVAGDAEYDGFMRLVNATSHMNLGLLMSLAAEEIVTDPSVADTIVSWDRPEGAREDAKLIRPCDIEAVASILR